MARKRTKTRRESGEGHLSFAFFAGMVIAACGIFLALSLLTADIALSPRAPEQECLTGLVGVWAAYGAILTFGRLAAFGLAGLLIAWAWQILQYGAVLRTWPQVLGGALMLLTAGLVHASAVPSAPVEAIGLVADQATLPGFQYVGRGGVAIFGSGIFFVGAILAFGSAVLEGAHALGRGIRGFGLALIRIGRACLHGTILRLRPGLAAAWNAAGSAVVPADRRLGTEPDFREVAAAVVDEEEDETFDDDDLEQDEEEEAEEEESGDDTEPVSDELDEDEDEEEENAEAPAPPAPTVRKSAPYASAPPRRNRPRRKGKAYRLPPMDLLEPPATGDGENEQSLQRRARTLEKTLSEFNIDGRVVHIECGPRVTLYEISLAPGIKLSRIMNLADNISMALKAHNVRIIAPIPGRDTVGIEIPNIEKDLVTLGEVLEVVNREKRRETLPICLAKDVSGRALVADLTKMPHLLIAGATGSGKSVCINSVILSFLMCCRPEEVKLILIDPKVVELSRFKKIPHLLCPVITDMKRAVNVLEWACQQMDERYEQLSMVGVNNIQKFNALGGSEIEKRLKGMYAPEELDLFPKELPYIVMIIDELADLMLVAKKEVETQITRLAAKSRAVGIHVIFATQRPSVDVITGLIKANMPCRIAFQVASRVDSRTILDQNGAETLLGAGDMLYLPPGVGKLTRAQGVYVSDEEMEAVVDFCHEQEPPEFHEDLEGPVVGGSRAGGDTPSDADELFHEAAFAILESGRGSVSLLQRRLGVGYGRAARIIDQLAEAGLLGPFREGKPRDILMTSEEFVHMYGDGSTQGSLLFGGPSEASAAARAGLREDENAPEELPWEEEAEDADYDGAEAEADEEWDEDDDENAEDDDEEYEYEEDGEEEDEEEEEEEE